MSISVDQATAARRVLGLSQEELAALAEVPIRILVEFENGVRQPRPAARAALQAALEVRGALFTPDNGICLSWASLAIGRAAQRSGSWSSSS